MKAQLQPVLENNLVKIRPMISDDFKDLYAVASDQKLWEQHPASDRFQEPVFRKLFEEGLHSAGAVVIIDKKTSKIIGSSRFYELDPENESVTIGYSFLARAFWGGEYNRSIKTLLVNHALGFASKIYFSVGVQNMRSQKAMEKLGARIDGRSNSSKIVYVIDAPL